MQKFLEKFKELPRNASLRSVVTLEWVNAVQDAIRALSGGENILVSGDVGKSFAEGRVGLHVKRKFTPFRRGGAAACPFGGITRWTTGEGESAVTHTGIKGGLIYCGDQNWNMDPQELNLEAAGVWLVYFEIDVIANQDDDEQYILPGIKTGTEPTEYSKLAWTEGTNYPDNTAPVVGTGAGTIIVPLGKLTITDGGESPGVASFEPAACGNITVTQCGGTLAHTRS